MNSLPMPLRRRLCERLRNSCPCCPIFLPLIFFALVVPMIHGAMPVFYDVVELERFGRSQGHVMAINDRGQAVGTVSGTLPLAMVFWDLNDNPADGETHLLQDPDHYFGRLDDINNHGIAVGIVRAGDSRDYYGMKYDVANRGVTRLEGLSDEDGNKGSSATSINDLGVAVGYSGVDAVLGTGLKPVQWTGSAPVSASGTLLHGSEWFYININAVMAGTLNDLPVRGKANAFSALVLPPNHLPFGKATAINDDGVTTGWVKRMDGNQSNLSAVVWDPAGVPAILPPLGPGDGVPFGINNTGDIVGTAANQGVVWQRDAFDYRIHVLDLYTRPPGWRIVVARDINDLGWIGAEATFGTTHRKPVILVPRIDELPPEGRLASEPPSFGDTRYDLLVYWEDDGMIDESTLDNHDLRITLPDHSSVLAELKSVGSPVQVGERWRWPVRYEMPAPGGSWNDEDNGEYVVNVEADQVADLSGRHVEAGELGRFSFNGIQAPVWIRQGTTRSPGGSERYGFELGFDGTAQQAGNYPPVASARFRAPSGQWFDMTSVTPVLWRYELSGDAPSALDPFGDGTYEMELSFGIGSRSWEFWFGDVAGMTPLEVPAQFPVFLPMEPTVQGDGFEVGLSWDPVTDGHVNQLRLAIHETPDGGEVHAIGIDDPRVNAWGGVALEQENRYVATLTFEQAVNHQTVDVWSLTVSRYLASEAVIETPAALSYPESPRLQIESGPTLSVMGEPGLWVRIEFADDLSFPSWQTLTPLQLSGSPQPLVDFFRNSPHQRFYRIVLLGD